MTKPKAPKRLPASALPDPTPAERAAIADAMQRVEQRRATRRSAPKVRVDARRENAYILGAPHSDEDGHVERLRDALGTTSSAFFDHTLSRLVPAAKPKGEEAPEHVERTINAGLAFINAAEPENEIEAALAAQMFATHSLSLTLVARANAAESMAGRESYVNMATKVQRTFVAQVEALAKLKSKGKQVVEVRHIHVHGDAVFGDVRTGGGGGGVGGYDRQARAIPDLSGSDYSEVRGEDAVRLALSVDPGTGPQALPDARRGAGKRGAVRSGQRAVSARPADEGGGGDASPASGAAERGAGDDEAPSRLGRRRPTRERSS